ncbi:MAG: hypothetical protein QOE22_277 [Candidatus Parcubacteria bacterium]|jgi:hypothetical protein|nr:hypothetical protein [Candidatus Parcubacteria bacterium]
MAYDDEDEVLDIDKGLLDEDDKKIPDGFHAFDPDTGLPIEEDLPEDELEEEEVI